MLITGTKASEQLAGTSADDTLDGAGGSDTIDGGAGLDTLTFTDPYYQRIGSDIGVDLSAGTAMFVYDDGTGFPVIESTTLTGIENVVGSSLGDRLSGDNDTNLLDGRDGADNLNGRGGNDTLLGGLGDDALIGGTGDDLLDGGSGIDTVFYADFSTTTGVGRVVIDLSVGRAWSDEGTDTLISIEDVFATSGNDWIRGTDGRNHIDAGAGDDVVIGNGSTGDVLVGASGNDAIYGGSGNDIISGDDGIDWLEGGAGDDLIYDGGTTVGEWSAIHGGTGNDTLGALGAGDLGIWGEDGNDRIEIWYGGTIYAHGGSGADTYVLTDSMLQSDGGLLQIFDFEPEDSLQTQFADPARISIDLHDWGQHTGITYTDTTTGNTMTVILMDVPLRDEATPPQDLPLL